MLCLLAAVGFAVTSCEDYTGKYEMTGGTPTIYYVRPTDAAKADSLLTGAYMGSTVCLVGDNLTSIQELFFNDVKATPNINFITKNTLIVSVPNVLPDAISNKIWMVTERKDTIGYDFVTQIPNPSISRIYCDNVPEGGTVTLIGDYMLDYPNAHISVTIGNYTVPYEHITHVEKTTLSFIAPPAEVSGYITVTSTYGSNTRSYRSLFRDGDPEVVQYITRFEPTENNGTGFVPGWGRPGTQQLQNDPALAISGTYVRWDGALTGGEWASGSPNYVINIWGCNDSSNPNSGIPDPMFTFKPEEAALKFDINVMQAWSGLPIALFFTKASDAENYLWGDDTYPRAFYAPWTTAPGASYVSNGWETVTIPLTDFKYIGSGATVDISDGYSNLGIAIHNRGGAAYAGTDCSPVILIDNIRVIKIQ
jgi:hypothetical protein